MKTVKRLQDDAAKQQEKATYERKEAQKHRENASAYKSQDDPHVPLRENELAQKAEEKAQLYDRAANELLGEASRIEDRVILLEREKQTKQVAMQTEIDRLEDEAKRLRGQ
jgi:hypothetical protein